MESKNILWNPETEEFEIRTDTEKSIPSNIVGVEDGIVSGFNIDYATMAAELNDLVKRGIYQVVRCKSCGLYFIRPKWEKEWYLEQELVPPKRCRCCREAKKRDRNVKKTKLTDVATSMQDRGYSNGEIADALDLSEGIVAYVPRKTV